MCNQGDNKSNMHDRCTIQSNLFYATPRLSYDGIKGAQKGVNTIKNTGKKQEIEPQMDRPFVREEERDVFTGKSFICTRIIVHNQTTEDEKGGDGKSGDDTQFLRLKYYVDRSHFTTPNLKQVGTEEVLPMHRTRPVIESCVNYRSKSWCPRMSS